MMKSCCVTDCKGKSKCRSLCLRRKRWSMDMEKYRSGITPISIVKFDTIYLSLHSSGHVFF